MKLSTGVVCCLLLLSSGAKSAENIQSYFALKRAERSLKQGDGARALELYFKALIKNPTSPKIYFNLGAALAAQGRFDEAAWAYETSLKLDPDQETKFSAQFNLGELLGRQKKIDEALIWYQAALRTSPESMETKTNIELLMRNQQGGGSGKGDQSSKGNDQDQKKDQKNNENKNENEKNERDKENDKEKDPEKKPKNLSPGDRSPKPFKSENLTPENVNQILNEIKQQEQKIRSEFQNKGKKQSPQGKDW
jgi:Ca-activated chloride channel homolog